MATVATTMVAEAEAHPSDAVVLAPPQPVCDSAATFYTPRTEASAAAPSAARMSTSALLAEAHPTCDAAVPAVARTPPSLVTVEAEGDALDIASAPVHEKRGEVMRQL
ncbi:hypothetical protein BHE74_00056863 [Ensete ventricosum]|nr:hypothetical protein BHE74_00056863 [Ensete ventricosum]